MVHARLGPRLFEVRKFAAAGAGLGHDAGIMASLPPARKDAPPLGQAADIPYNGRGRHVSIREAGFRSCHRGFASGGAAGAIIFFVQELSL